MVVLENQVLESVSGGIAPTDFFIDDPKPYMAPIDQIDSNNAPIWVHSQN